MRTPHARLLGFILGGLLPVLAVAAPVRDAPSLLLFTPGLSRQVSLYPAAAVGPGIHLVLEEGVVRGRAFGRSVYLSLGEDAVDGMVGTQPAALAFQQAGDGPPRLEGTLIGSPVRLRASPGGLTGTVGPCTYDLTLRAGAYEGGRSCMGTPWQPVRLLLPPGLLEQGAVLDRVALLVLLGL